MNDWLFESMAKQTLYKQTITKALNLYPKVKLTSHGYE